MISRKEDLDGNGFLGIPSFSIRRNKVVLASHGQYEKLLISGRPVDPLELARALFKQFDVIHILDLDGFHKGSPDTGFVQKASQSGDLWMDPGLGIAEPLIDMFMSGADQAVVSSKAINGLKELVNAVELSEDIIFQLDYDGGKLLARNEVMKAMGIDALVDEAKDIGIYRFILADYTCLDSGGGPDLDLLSGIIEKHKDIELFAAVGIEPKHMPQLEDAGLMGAILDLRSVLDEIRISF